MPPHTGRTALDATGSVRVSYNARGPWDVVQAGEAEHTTCETLEDAQRVGYLFAARKTPCELIVCDAYRRVVRREVVRHRADARHIGDLV
jgi:hypothetical protein